MAYSNLLRRVTLFILLTTALHFRALAEDFRHLFSENAPARVGLEMEFATVGFLNPQWGEQHIAVARDVFSAFFSHFGGSASSISVVPWEKYPDKNLTKVVYTSRSGKSFEIVPESVNSGGHDGLELVIPPLENRAEIESLKKALDDVKKKRIVMRGIRSSNHQTFDVTHLIEPDGNANKLYNLILFIESNWHHIFRNVNPQRYGAIVNRFGIPLAANQQDLLSEIAAVPENQRTVENLRQIFLKYQDKETELMPDGKAWKYRAGNYAKLLGLVPGRRVPAIEIRIPDLQFGDGWIRTADFLSAVFKVGANTPSRNFQSPFGRETHTWQTATQYLQRFYRQNDYLPFMQRLQVEPSSQAHTFWENNDVFSPEELERKLRPATAELVARGGKKVTFGIEAEFKPVDNNWIHDRTLLRDAPGFLHPKVDQEGTGNLEIRSKGGETKLADVESQLEMISRQFEGNLRGFHMHMRIPDELWKQIPKEKLQTWFSLIGDYIWAWRLQNRNPFFALKTETNGRLSPEQSMNDERASLRVSEENGYLDVEIRGFMGDYSNIVETARMILTGIEDPSLIQVEHVSYEKLFRESYREDIIHEASKLAQRLYGQELTYEQTSKLKHHLQVESYHADRRTIPPILDLHSVLDFLSPAEQRRVREASQEILRRLVILARGNYNQLSSERYVDFARTIGLQALLKRGILRPPVTAAQLRRGAQNLDRAERVIRLQLNELFLNSNSGDVPDFPMVLLNQIHSRESRMDFFAQYLSQFGEHYQENLFEVMETLRLLPLSAKDVSFFASRPKSLYWLVLWNSHFVEDRTQTGTVRFTKAILAEAFSFYQPLSNENPREFLHIALLSALTNANQLENDAHRRELRQFHNWIPAHISLETFIDVQKEIPSEHQEKLKKIAEAFYPRRVGAMTPAARVEFLQRLFTRNQIDQSALSRYFNSTDYANAWLNVVKSSHQGTIELRKFYAMALGNATLEQHKEFWQQVSGSQGVPLSELGPLARKIMLGDNGVEILTINREIAVRALTQTPMVEKGYNYANNDNFVSRAIELQDVELLRAVEHHANRVYKTRIREAIRSIRASQPRSRTRPATTLQCTNVL